MKVSPVIIGCLLFSVACSKVKELDKRTENMEQATQKMSKTTGNMNGTTDVMYEQIRSGDTAKLRMDSFRDLTNPKVQIGSKFASAAIFFQAMEFQLWTDNGLYDNPEQRDLMYLDAANELTQRLCDIHDAINMKRMNPTVSVRFHNEEMSFYALSAAMHMNHHYQTLLAEKKSDLQTSSMYDIIKKTLVKEHKNKPLNEYEDILMNGSNKQMMIDLFHARIDMLSALGLKNLTDKKNMTLTQKAKAALFIMTFGHYGTTDLPEVYDISNDSTKDWTEEYLDGALKAKAVLASIGVEHKLQKTLTSAFKNIDFNQPKNDITKDAKREKIREQIKKLLE